MASTAAESDHIRLAKQVFDWFEQHDLEALLDALGPDVKARPSIHGGPVLEGRDAVARWLREFADLGDELEARPLGYELNGNCVIVRGYLRHREGRTLAESQAFWVFEIRGGLIRRMESHPTRRAALAAC